MGKTIQGLVVVKGNRIGPRDQVVLLFADGTGFELFGGDIHLEGKLQVARGVEAWRSLGDLGGEVTHYSAERTVRKFKKRRLAP